MKITMKKIGGYDAIAELENDVVTVLKGSKIASKYSDKLPKEAIRARKEAQISRWILQEDYSFSSASTAAAFVNGNVSNGLIIWRTNDGKKLKEVYDGKTRKVISK